MPHTAAVPEIERCARSVRGLGNSHLVKRLGQVIPDMEPTMKDLKVLSRTIAIAVLALIAAGAAYAVLILMKQNPTGGRKG